MLKLNDLSLDGKLENKDLFLAWVWHSYRAYPFKPYILGIGCLLPC
jgi:hypothetical protein